MFVFLFVGDRSFQGQDDYQTAGVIAGQGRQRYLSFKTDVIEFFKLLYLICTLSFHVNIQLKNRSCIIPQVLTSFPASPCHFFPGGGMLRAAWWLFLLHYPKSNFLGGTSPMQNTAAVDAVYSHIYIHTGWKGIHPDLMLCTSNLCVLLSYCWTIIR